MTAYLNTRNPKRRYFLSRVSRYRIIPAAVTSTARIAAMRRASIRPATLRSTSRQGEQPGKGSRRVLLALESHPFPGIVGGKGCPQQTVVQGMAGFMGGKIADQRVPDQV